MAPRPLLAQTELRKRLRASTTELRKRRIADIESFVADRLQLFDATLPSLELLSDRDLEFLTGAIDNC